MSVAPASVVVANSKNVQVGVPKNIVPDPEWFDSI